MTETACPKSSLFSVILKIIIYSILFYINVSHFEIEKINVELAYLKMCAE